MSDETISIPLDQVRQVGGEFKTASKESLEVLNRLRRAVDALEPEWQGVAKDRFYQEFRQWEMTMRQFSQLLETVGTRLETLSNEVAETDRSGARRIERLSTSL